MNVIIAPYDKAKYYEIPEYQSNLSSGVDLHSADEIVIPANSFKLVDTNISICMIDTTHEAQVRSRSGLAAKHGIFVLNSPGTLDNDYSGPIKVILCNITDTDFKISIGDRIAQMVFCAVERVSRFSVVDDVKPYHEKKNSVRGDGGFGSTGI